MQLLGIVGAVLLIGVGLVVLPMPIPLGAIMILTGFALLIAVSPAATDRLRGFRRRHGKLDAKVRQAERLLPKRLRELIERTDP